MLHRARRVRDLPAFTVLTDVRSFSVAFERRVELDSPSGGELLVLLWRHVASGFSLFVWLSRGRFLLASVLDVR